MILVRQVFAPKFMDPDCFSRASDYETRACPMLRSRAPRMSDWHQPARSHESTRTKPELGSISVRSSLERTVFAEPCSLAISVSIGGPSLDGSFGVGCLAIRFRSCQRSWRITVNSAHISAGVLP